MTHARVWWRGLLIVLALLGTSVQTYAQEVERVGKGQVTLDRRLDRLIRAGDYTLITDDTLIGVRDTVPTSVLVLDARLTLAGTVMGEIIGVEADLFIRPTASVDGDIINIGGGLYRSELAETTGAALDEPLARYRVHRSGDVIQIESKSEHVPLRLHGILGFETPSYDRVDAIGLSWGATYRPRPIGSTQPALTGRVGYRSGRGAWQGKTELSLSSAKTTLAVGAEEVTQTNEWWIRSAGLNSIGYLTLGTDVRDYFEVRRGYARLDRRLERGTAAAVIQLRAQVERDRSIAAGHPWTIIKGSRRENLPIDDGTITSLLLSTFGGWNGASAQLEGGTSIEIAGRRGGGDFSFNRFTAWGEWAMLAFKDHTLEIEWQLRGPLPGTQSLPRQRWSFIGGAQTLSTFSTGEFRGDRVVFVESTYIIPLPEHWSVPGLGVPDLEAFHASGMAWTHETSRRFEQNIGVRLVFLSPYLRLATDPRDPIRSFEIGVGLTSPFSRHYPWLRNLP